MISLVDSDKWAFLIGRVFIAFGKIEHTTHSCLSEWLNPSVYKHVKRLNFSTRVELLIDLSQTLDFKKHNIEGFVRILREIKKLAEKRNLIAHNPLMLCFFKEEGEFTEAIASSHKDDVYMEYHELEDLLLQVEKLSSDLIDGVTKFKLENWKGVPKNWKWTL